MNRIKCLMIIGTIFVLITGTLAHFVYGWTGKNQIAGLFTPVNESIWEHMKLLFFPMLLYTFYAIIKFDGEGACLISSICFGILIGTFLIPALYYAYTSVLGKGFLIVDIGIFVLSVIIAFFIAYKFTLSCRLKPYTLILAALVCVLFVCFLIFTYNPPNLAVFADPTAD